MRCCWREENVTVEESMESIYLQLISALVFDFLYLYSFGNGRYPCKCSVLFPILNSYMPVWYVKHKALCHRSWTLRLMLVRYECWFSARVGTRELASHMQKVGRLHFPKLWHNLWKDLLIKGEFNNIKTERPDKWLMGGKWSCLWLKDGKTKQDSICLYITHAKS